MKKMNLQNSSQRGSEHQERRTSKKNDAYLTVDGQAWDVSNLLNSLPSDKSTKEFERLGSRSSSSASDRKKSPYSRDDKQQEAVRKLPASLKKTHDENLTLKPVPKYDWRSRSKSPPPPPAASPSQADHAPSSRSRSPEEPYYEQEEQHQEQLPDDFERSLIEVFPGVEMPLRGSFETQAAIARNYIISASCMDCTLQLQCIRNAEYILCPLCHCVSPLELSCRNIERDAFGVGLGFVDEEL
jgi:hypothetical protein